MKRSNMKSNIALQPRCRPEGRLFPRRKVAVKSHLLNGVGDFDMELSLAIQESLKYAQEKEDELRENGLCDTNGPKSDEKSDKCDLSPTPGSRTERPRTCGKSPSAMASTDWGSEEVGRLKDLLMSQAELIQCQQEEIENKDRQIKALQSSRDALQCRLERMERRMSILKHKEDSHDGQVPATLDSIGKAAVPSLQVSHKRPNEATSIDFKKRRRRGHKLNFSQRKRHKRQRLVKSASRESTEERDEESDDEEEGETSDESDSGDEDDSRSQDSEDSGSHKEEKDNRDESEDESCIQEERTIDYPIMQTETLYHLYYPKHCSLSPDTTKRAQEQTEVETPSWRLKPLTNMYQLEGTENITDEAYFKRHQKFELEEKRRKRWDLQRLRELRISEKLQREREDEIRASQEEVDVETFLPSIHDLKHIEITEAIPVMAFGQPVPYVSPAEFEIPWEITNSGPVASTSRQRVNSVHSRRH